MNDQSNTLNGTAFNLERFVDYADGSVVKKILLKKDIGNIAHALRAKAPFKMLLVMIRGEENAGEHLLPTV